MNFKHKGNVAHTEKTKGLWNVIEDQYGNSSLTVHKPKVIWESCETKDHNFELTNSGMRECTCSKCGFITTFIVGLQSLVEGKIINVR